MALGPGERLGPYEILSRLGAGGMGVVYRARDTHLQRTVALKVLSARPELAGTADQLLHEARTISALNHPNICTVHEVREEAGQIFIVMEYVDGRALQEQIPIGGLPADSLLRYAVQLADGLAHAHDRGVLHRDLKSANVMITRDGRTKIVDFGLASGLVQVSHEEATRSQSPVPGDSALAGTLAYMAPEVIHGDHPGPLSDLWSVGVLLYEMATGHLPFTGSHGVRGDRGDSSFAAASVADTGAPEPPHDHRAMPDQGARPAVSDRRRAPRRARGGAIGCVDRAGPRARPDAAVDRLAHHRRRRRRRDPAGPRGLAHRRRPCSGGARGERTAGAGALIRPRSLRPRALLRRDDDRVCGDG